MKTDKELNPTSQASSPVDLFRNISDGKQVDIDDLLNLTLEDIESISTQLLLTLNIDQINNLFKIVIEQLKIYQTIINTHGIIWKALTFISKKNQEIWEQQMNQIKKLEKWYNKLNFARIEIQFFTPNLHKTNPIPTIQTSPGDADDLQLD